jgi:hypothetical protein
MAEASSQVRIDRIHARYLCPRDHPWPNRLKATLDGVVERGLRASLAPALRPLVRDEDEGVWLVRRLEVGIALNAAWDQGGLTRAVAPPIARAIAAVLRAVPDGDNVVWFPSRAAYLARFLAGVVDGSAWRRWYFGRFEGLRPLPRSAALRTALEADSGVGLAALHALAPSELRGLLHALTRHDAEGVLARLASEGRGGTVEASIAMLAPRLAGVQPPSDAADEARLALGLCVEVTRVGTRAVDPALMRTALVAARLVRLRATTPQGTSEELRGTLTGVAGAEEGSGSRGLDAAMAEAVRGAGPAAIDALLEACAPVVRAPTAGASGRAEHVTPSGGIFFLLPVLAEMPITSATVGWPPLAGAPADALVRWLVLAKCTGRGVQALDDPVLRAMCALAAGVRLDDLVPWGTGIGRPERDRLVETVVRWGREREVAVCDGDAGALAVPAVPVAPAVDRVLGVAAALLVRAWARRLPGFATSSIPYLRANLLDVGATLVPEPARRTVRVRRAPLALLLSITGMARATYRLPWLEGGVVAVFPET